MYARRFLILWSHAQLHPLPIQKDLAMLDDLAADFDASTFDWEKVKPYGILSHCMRSGTSKITCGKLLAHCMYKIDCFRSRMGIRLCVFKIGVTHNPLARWRSYHEVGFSEMWLLATCSTIDMVHMLEAALISQYCLHVGSRNKKASGGEGYLNRSDAPPGPYYAYIVGGRADQKGFKG